MSILPDPLHPAVVHFPIVLVLLGATMAIAAVFWRKHGLPMWAAVVLAAGALGTWGAVESGESDGGLVENASPQVNSLIDEHETWAKRTLTISILAAFVAGGSALIARWPRLARAVAVVAALVSLAAVYGVYETGHRGGTLVYRHGAGVSLATAASTALDAPKENTAKPDQDN